MSAGNTIDYDPTIKDCLTLNHVREYNHLERYLAMTAYKWGRSTVNERADLFVKNEQNQEFYLSLDPSMNHAFLKCLDETCLQEALPLMNTDILSRALCDSDLGVWILNQLAAMKGMSYALSVLTQTTDEARRKICEKQGKVKILRAISNMQAGLPLEAGVKYVATASFFTSSIPQSAVECVSCSHGYAEWHNIILNKCFKHSRHAHCPILCPCSEEKNILNNISWDIRNDPSEAINIKDSAPVNLSETLVDGDISLTVADRYEARQKDLKVNGWTIGDIFQTVHDFYVDAEVKFAETHGEEHFGRFEDHEHEDVEEFGWDMGSKTSFEGFTKYKGLWVLHLGS
jgi:hypothetical protein